MMGKAAKREEKLFYVGFSLDARIPCDHPLRAIDAAVDFTFVRPLVADTYGSNGNPSLDPSIILKLLFLCFYENVRSERELMRQLPLRLDWMWFCGLALDDSIPDHSVLSKARRRWGQVKFESVFAHVLELCRQADLIGGQTLHADSTRLQANASLEGRVSRVLWEQLEEAGGERSDNGDCDDDGPGPTTPAHDSRKRPKLNDRLVSPADPDAATTSRKVGGTMLGYRDHRLIDDRAGIITATIATPGDRDDGSMLPALLDRHESYGQQQPQEVVGDSMYGTRSNYALLEEKKISGYLKKRRGKDSPKTSWLNLLPACCSRKRALYLMGRRRTCAEGRFAEAHMRMNHRRSRWRRQWRVQIQCYLVAMVQNVKKLIKAGGKPGRSALAEAQRQRPNLAPWAYGIATIMGRKNRPAAAAQP